MDEKMGQPARAGGRTVIITGAGSGIGRAMAHAFGQSGAQTVLFDIDRSAIERVGSELAEAGAAPPALFQGSVTDETIIAEVCGAVCARFGRIDVLLNNAGIAMNRPTLDLSGADWRRAIDINLTGIFLFAQAVARHMAAGGGGVILNTASMYGLVAAPERAAYCASKAAVVALSKVMAIEWAKLGIRVNALAPGYVRTALMEDLARQGRLDIDALIRRIPQGRLGSPEEIARIALFLAEEDAALITGQTVVADGGWTAYGYL